ncbi:MAG: extracellular solute-binding protein [Salinivirgaceae bacterium]|nr:extracellular solute-binding protein [Salinivirgaceae bacterium]
MKIIRATSLFIFAVILVFTSCIKDNEDRGHKKIERKIEPAKEIRFVGQWLNEGKRGTLIKDFTRQYEFENQQVIVDLKFPEEIFNDFADRESNVRFVNDIMTKKNPEWDIIRLNNQYRSIAELSGDSLWAKNNLVDFSKIPEFRNNTLPKLLTNEVKDTWGGIIPGPFLEGSYWALWTNKEVARKIGVEVKSHGMTFDDFLNYIKSVDSYNKINPHDYIIPIHEAADWQTAFAFVFQLYASALNNTTELFNIQVTENKVQAWYKTLKALQELSEFNSLGNNWKNLAWGQSNCDLIHEKCLFYTNGSWMYNIWESDDALKTMNAYPCEFPVFNEINLYPSAYFITWAVLKNSPNRDEAVKLLLAMNKPDFAELWVQYTKCPTGVKGQMTDVNFGGDQFENFSHYVQSKYGDNNYNYSEELCVNVVGTRSVAGTYYLEVLTGDMSADEAMELIRLDL